jgi:hypothetical protein
MSVMFLKNWVTRDYKCDSGMSVENVPAVVDIKTLKGRFIAHKFSTGWVAGVVKSVEKKKSVAGHALQSSISQKRITGLKN